MENKEKDITTLEFVEIIGIFSTYEAFYANEEAVSAYLEDFKKKHEDNYDNLKFELRVGHETSLFTGPTLEIINQAREDIDNIIKNGNSVSRNPLLKIPEGGIDITSREAKAILFPSSKELKNESSDERIKRFIDKMAENNLPEDVMWMINRKISEQADPLFGEPYQFSDDEISAVIEAFSQEDSKLVAQDAECLLEAFEQGLQAEEVPLAADIISISIKIDDEEQMGDTFSLLKKYMESNERKEKYNLPDDYEYSYWMISSYPDEEEKLNVISLTRELPTTRRGFVIELDRRKLGNIKTKMMNKALHEIDFTDEYVGKLFTYALKSNPLNYHLIMELVIEGLEEDKFEEIKQKLETENKDGFNYTAIKKEIRKELGRGDRGTTTVTATPKTNSPKQPF